MDPEKRRALLMTHLNHAARLITLVPAPGAGAGIKNGIFNVDREPVILEGVHVLEKLEPENPGSRLAFHFMTRAAKEKAQHFVLTLEQVQQARRLLIGMDYANIVVAHNMAQLKAADILASILGPRSDRGMSAAIMADLQKGVVDIEKFEPYFKAKEWRRPDIAA